PTVTDPLAITGRLDEPITDYERMIDSTAVAAFNDAAFRAGAEFVLQVPIEFVSEGAHIVWIRRRGAAAGWAHRQVFLWRPSKRAGCATDRAVFAIPRRVAPLPPSLEIDGRVWPHVEWKTMHGTRGITMVGVADLSALPPGNYTAGVRLVGRVVAEQA